MMKGGQLPTKDLSDSNWGTLYIDHASRVPDYCQITSMHILFEVNIPYAYTV